MWTICLSPYRQKHRYAGRHKSRTLKLHFMKLFPHFLAETTFYGWKSYLKKAQSCQWVQDTSFVLLHCTNPSYQSPRIFSTAWTIDCQSKTYTMGKECQSQNKTLKKRKTHNKRKTTVSCQQVLICFLNWCLFLLHKLVSKDSLQARIQGRWTVWSVLK